MARCSATTFIWEPDVESILDRARGLSVPEILRLAALYRRATTRLDGEPAGPDPALDRPRVISIAASRSGRRSEVHQLQGAAGDAVETAVGSEEATHALLRLGMLGEAEHAVGDAAIAELLADRFSPQIAQALAAPWRDVR